MIVVYRPLTRVEMLDELEPSVARGLDRHLGTTNEWFPHQFVPYEDGRNYAEEGWSASDSRLPDVAQTALEVNLLTEDNLPYYHLSIWDAFGRHESWAEWVRRWTAEEAALAIDPSRSRMDMVITDLDGLTDEGELARDSIVAHMDRLAHVASMRDEPAASVVTLPQTRPSL